MAKLRQREDGGYYTKVKAGPGLISTLQITSEGVRYLFRHGVQPGMQIPDSHRRVLQDKRWFYTKGEQPGPGVLGNEDLRDHPREMPRETGMADVLAERTSQTSQAHAGRPMFLFDPPTNTYYTVLHLNGGSAFSEPTVMCIKYLVAQRLKDQGAVIGRELPEGVFDSLFLNRSFYPRPGWTPLEARPVPLTQEYSPSSVGAAHQSLN